MTKLTTFIAACLLAACAAAPVTAAEHEPVCEETYAEVQALAAAENYLFLETDDVANAISVVEGFIGPVPDYITQGTVQVIALVAEGNSLVVIGFVDYTGCVIGAITLPVEVRPLIFG